MIKFLWNISVLCFCTLSVEAQFFKKHEPFAHTFSIVARDSATGEMAVAVQSHWFSVGTVVSWAESGVGAIATQSFANKSFGPRGLVLLKNGATAQQALDSLLANDAGKDVRQVSIIDNKGNVATHTGSKCIDFAGHKTGVQFSVQSNMMLTNKVNDAMYSAFLNSKHLPLAERMVKALEAAQSAGGDLRGKQSAALLVVKGQPSTDAPWDDKLIDLRVEDHSDPINELSRLLKVQRAYEYMNAGDLYIEKNDMENANKAYAMAQKLFPSNMEIQYWQAITLANNKKINQANKLLQKIYKKDKNWLELTKRLPKVGLLNVDSKDLAKLTSIN